MIRINKEMIMNTAKVGRREPPDVVIKKETSRLKKIFTKSLGWELTPLAEKTIPIIARRMCDRMEDSEWDNTHKGAALLGNVGTGKTILLSFAAHMIDVSVFNVPELSRIYTLSGADGFWNRVMDRSYIGKDMILDDLGAESDAKRFGAPFPIIDLIYRRYDIWRSYGHRLWISSNLTAKEIASPDKYGPRVADRLKEMCHVVPALGDSLRK